MTLRREPQPRSVRHVGFDPGLSMKTDGFDQPCLDELSNRRGDERALAAVVQPEKRFLKL